MVFMSRECEEGDLESKSKLVVGKIRDNNLVHCLV